MALAKELFEIIVPIITAIIAGLALVKVNRIDNQDKIRRALWAMEQYLFLAGKCLENPNEENIEMYTSIYLLINMYIDKELRIKLKTIDDLIKKNKMDNARENILDLANVYYEKYRMNIYAPRPRRLRWFRK